MQDQDTQSPHAALEPTQPTNAAATEASGVLTSTSWGVPTSDPTPYLVAAYGSGGTLIAAYLLFLWLQRRKLRLLQHLLHDEAPR